MSSPVKNLNHNSAVSKNTLSFKGIKTGKIAHLNAINIFSDCRLDGIYQNLKNNVAPDFIYKSGSEAFYKKSHSFMDTLKYPFTKMPLELLNAFANKFNIESLQNSKLLTNFRKAGENEKYERALRGLLQNGDNLFNSIAQKEGIGTGDIDKLLCNENNRCKPGFKNICNKVTDEFYKLFDENLKPDKAKYNTTHERTIARIVSGITAALIMGIDFYNKSIKNGKTDTEAKEEAKSKRNQELIECGQEAISQYFMLGAFSSFVNNSTFAAPILNTLLSLVFRVTSRLSTGRPLTRIKAPENTMQAKNILTMNNFIDSIKNNNPLKFEEITPQNQNKKEKKKHILSLRNITLACLTSIGAGFALRKFKDTKAFENIKNEILKSKPIAKLSEKYHNATTGKLFVSNDELEKFYEALKDKPNMKKYYKDNLMNVLRQKPKCITEDGKIFIGEYEKFAKIPFTNIEISKKELYTMPLAPFRIAKEIITYPYKLVSAALEGLGVIKKTKSPELKNEFNMVNTILDFRKQAEKFGGNTESEEFLNHYKKHIEENCYNALNKETKSNINNCDIGKLTALLGTFASIYFATTDDYNATLKQTGDVDKANKDARLRGINKIIRTSVQCVFLGLNNLFKIPYSKSLLGVGAVTAGCTILTDSVSRILSGMPFRKMNKEELEEYNKSKQEGALKGYYNALDKLTD